MPWTLHAEPVVLLSDTRIAEIDLTDIGEPLISLPHELAAGRPVRVREGLARRLTSTARLLPPDTFLHVVEGHRDSGHQQHIIDMYRAEVIAAHPYADSDEVDRLTSRFVSPLSVAPHVAGAAVDVTLIDSDGCQLDLGTAIDATPEQSNGRCYFDSADITDHQRENRETLARVLSAVGLVNYPTEWWHWSYGDRYWAFVSAMPCAIYGPIGATS